MESVLKEDKVRPMSRWLRVLGMLLFVVTTPLWAQSQTAGGVEAQLDSANAALEVEDLIRADGYLKNFESSIATIDDPQILARYFNLYGEFHFHRWKLDSAEEAYAKGLEYALRAEDSKLVVGAYSGTADVMVRQGNYHQGAYFYDQAFRWSADLDSAKYYYPLVANQAIALSDAGESDKALSGYLRVKKYAVRTGKLKFQALVENNLGELYRSSFDQPEIAKTHFRKAISLNREIESDLGLARNYHNLSLLHHQQGELDSALHYNELARHHRRIAGDTGGLALEHHNMGNIQLGLDQPERALEEFGQTVAISKREGITLGLIHGHIGLGATHHAMNRNNTARSHLDTALSLARSIQAQPLVSEVLNALYELEQDDGNAAQALTYYIALKAVDDSITARINADRLAELQVKYETDMARAENEQLKADQAVQQAQLVAQKRNMIWLLVAIVVLGAFGGIFFQLERRRRKAHAKEKQLREELEVKHRQLMQQDDKLKEAHQMKDQIFSVIGHDLRSPLISIHSVVKLLAEGAIDESELPTLMTQLSVQTETSLQSLNRLLEWSRQNYDRHTQNHQDINLCGEIDYMKNVLNLKLQEKNLTLRNRIEETMVLSADPNQLRSILTNLLTNAIKFSPQGESIDVTATRTATATVLRIRDHGLGIPDKESPERIPDTRVGTKGERGTGIGLQIVRSFVESHRGKFQLTNHPDGGAMAVVHFPHKSLTDQSELTKDSTSVSQ